MTPAQLTLFFAVLLIWVILAEGIYPWLWGKTLRRDLRIAGRIVLLVLLTASFFAAPSFLLWLEYAATTLLVFIILWAYNRWALRLYQQDEV